MRREPGVRHSDGKPTIRQVYAIARLLLAETDERWPADRAEASELIERLRGGEEREESAAYQRSGREGGTLR